MADEEQHDARHVDHVAAVVHHLCPEASVARPHPVGRMGLQRLGEHGVRGDEQDQDDRPGAHRGAVWVRISPDDRRGEHIADDQQVNVDHGIANISTWPNSSDPMP